MQVLQKIKDIICASKEVAIISHYYPDGDALGSQIALALGLKQLGMKSVLINKDSVPVSYQFLPNWQSIQSLEQIEKFPKVVIYVDCATLERAGLNFQEARDTKITTINIDHHISNSYFADINWVDATRSAAAELIYDLLIYLQVKIDKEIATALYTGISTDTGSFLYENTTPKTHRAAADLIDYGANISLLRINYFENISRGKLELLKIGLNNLCFAGNNQIVWIAFAKKTFEAAGATDADGEGLINYIKSIAGIEVALIFREINFNNIKVSMRSKSWFNVNQLASAFGGGGHPRASGCVIKGKLNDVIEQVVNALEESLAETEAN